MNPQFSTLQYHTGITNWINNLWEKSNIPAYNKPVRIHCKASSVSARLVFETRAKCQDFVARFRDDGIPYVMDSPFSNGLGPPIQVTCRPGDRKTICACVENVGTTAQNPSLKVMAQVPLFVPALDARSHVLSMKDRRNGVGKPVFKVAPVGSGQLFALVAPDLCVPGSW